MTNNCISWDEMGCTTLYICIIYKYKRVKDCVSKSPTLKCFIFPTLYIKKGAKAPLFINTINPKRSIVLHQQV